MALTDELCQSFLDCREALTPAPDRAHIAALRSIAGAVEELEVEALADELDRTGLLDQLRVEQFRLEHERPWQRNPALWIEYAARGLEGPLPADLLSERLDALPGLLATAVTTLHEPPQVLLDTALALLDGLEEVVEAAPAPAGGPGIDAHHRAHRAIDLARTALAGHVAPDPSPHAAAIGETEVDRRIHHEHASIHNAAELWRAALREATDLEALVTAEAAAIDPARPWREVYAGARDRLPADADPVGALQFAVEAARQFSEAAGLPVPGNVPLTIRPAPGYVTVLEPEACWRPGELLVGRPDPLAIPWIAVELGVPGLHLHDAARRALPGLVRRHIVASSTPAGWALTMVDWMLARGYAAAPVLRLAGRVRLLRAAHLAVADLGVHTGQLTPAEAVGHLVTRLPCETAWATAQVRRIASRPLEAAAAMLGRRELARLRNDARPGHRAGSDEAAFYREVLGFGGLPVPLIRWGMGLDD